MEVVMEVVMEMVMELLTKAHHFHYLLHLLEAHILQGLDPLM